MSHSYTPIQLHVATFHSNFFIIPSQLSGLEEALEYYEIEEKFSRQKPKDGKPCSYCILCINLKQMYTCTIV